MLVFSVITAVVNTFKNVFERGLSVENYDWHQTSMAWKIEMGLFQGSFWQILSGFTWELPQTLIGYLAAGIYNLFGGVKSVGSYHGATVVESFSANWGGISLGKYIVGQRGIDTDPGNWLFQHEYGHYLQSRKFGLFYLSKFGIPSLLSVGRHDMHPAEQDANIRALKYFNQHCGSSCQWKSSRNPIRDYEWSRGFSDYFNQSILHRGVNKLAWYDWILIPGMPLIPGIVNAIIQNRNNNY